MSLTVLVAALIATTVAVFGMWIDTYGSAESRCDDSANPARTISVDSSVDSAYATAFPAGRFCLWKEWDGGAIAIEQTGWVPTWIAVGFLVLAVVAFFALIGTEWLIPGALLLVLILGGWVTIWFMSDTFLSPVFWPELPPSQLLPVGG